MRRLSFASACYGLVQLISIVPVSAFDAGAQKTDTLAFDIYDNYDLAVSSGQTISTNDMDQCKAACADDIKCRGFTFNKWTNQCRFVSDLTGRSRFDPSYSSGIAANSAFLEPSENPFSMNCRDQQHISGTPLKGGFPSTLATCVQTCTNETDCIGFNFSTAAKQCVLLGQSNGVATEAGSFSGYKVQSTTTNVETGAECAIAPAQPLKPLPVISQPKSTPQDAAPALDATERENGSASAKLTKPESPKTSDRADDYKSRMLRAHQEKHIRLPKTERKVTAAATVHQRMAPVAKRRPTCFMFNGQQRCE